MHLLIIATLLTAEPDAPVLDMKTNAGDVVPFKGYCVEEQEFIRREKINVRNDVVATEAQKNLLISTPVLVGLVLGAIATGVALTFTGIEVKKALDKSP